MPHESTKFNRAYTKPVGSRLPERSRETLRKRKYRSWFSNVSQLWKLAKTIGFILLISSLCYFAIVQLGHLFFETSYFEIKNLEVSGNNILVKDYILKVSKLSPGINVFLLDKDAARQRLLLEPLIKDVIIDFEGLYNLKIIIIERVPLLYAKVGTTFYEVSDDGMIINTEGYGEKKLPLITGLNLETNRIGDSLSEHDGFYIARNWIKTLDENMLDYISELNFKSAQTPYLIMLSGEKIYPKSLEDFKNRYDFLCALLDNLRKNNVEPSYLDMRALNGIVFRPKRIRRIEEESRRPFAGG